MILQFTCQFKTKMPETLAHDKLFSLLSDLRVKIHSNHTTKGNHDRLFSVTEPASLAS